MAGDHLHGWVGCRRVESGNFTTGNGRVGIEGDET